MQTIGGELFSTAQGTLHGHRSAPMLDGPWMEQQVCDYVLMDPEAKRLRHVNTNGCSCHGWTREAG